jgi:hypothetical protein
MDSDKIDILTPNAKGIFEIIFRKNVFIIILIVILANGYSNIPGMNELLTNIFASHFLRTLITFVLFFQITDNIKETLIWTMVIYLILYIIEYNYNKNKKLNIQKL